MMFLLTCDKKLTKIQLSPTHASTHKSLIKIVNQTIDKNENIVGVVLGNIVLFIWMEVIVK